MPNAQPMRWWTSCVLAASIVVMSLLISPNFRVGEPGRERTPYAGDFLHEWIGGFIVRAGDVTRLYDVDYASRLEHDPALVGFRLRADGFLPMVYPPAYYLLVSPLSAMPYRTAAWVWAGASLASFVAVIALLTTAFAAGGRLDVAVPIANPVWNKVAPLAALLALPAAVAFEPFAENLVSSQKGTFWLLIFTATFVALQGGARWSAGMLFGLQALKPQLAIVVPLAFALKGEWRFAMGAAATVALLGIASLAMGMDVARDYVRFAGDAAEFIRHGTAHAHRFHGAYAFFTLLAGGPTTIARLATAAVIVVVAVVVARLLRGRLDPTSPQFLFQFSGLVLATLIVSPHTITYDLTILLLPLALLCFATLRRGLERDRGRAIFWCAVALYVMCGCGPWVAQRTGVQLTLPLMTALLILVTRQTLTAAR
jgi:alpha-1,2-mannosyltransferase